MEDKNKGRQNTPAQQEKSFIYVHAHTRTVKQRAAVCGGPPTPPRCPKTSQFALSICVFFSQTDAGAADALAAGAGAGAAAAAVADDGSLDEWWVVIFHCFTDGSNVYVYV